MKARLFWKILLAFWLTFFAITQGVWLLFLFQRNDMAPPERFMAEQMAPTLLAAAQGAVERSARAGFDDLAQSLPPEQQQRLQLRGTGEAQPSHSRGLVRSISRKAVSPGGETFTIDYRFRNEPRQGGIFNMPRELLALGLIGGLFFAAMLAWYLTRPINQLRKGFDRLAQGRLSERLAPIMGNRRDEIADLARDFDLMAQRLEELVASRDRLLHDVSHELRSPLARLQLAIGLARQAPDRTNASLDRIDREAARLDTLVGELLSLARTEHRGMNGDDYFDLAGVLRSVVEDAQFEARSSDVKIGLSDDIGAADQVPPLRGDAETVRRAIDNIIRNALRFSPPGQEVDIRYSFDRNLHSIIVSDRGPGIDASNIDAMFQPFARGADKSSGFGLGLAIAKRAIELHGGVIEASNRTGGGLLVKLIFPCPASTLENSSASA